MAYDAENRPLSVVLNGVRTEYVYAADGTQLKMIANVGTVTANTTLYLGPLEVQNFGGVTTDDNYIATPTPTSASPMASSAICTTTSSARSF